MSGIRDAVVRQMMNCMIELSQEELKLVHGLITMRLKSLRIGE